MQRNKEMQTQYFANQGSESPSTWNFNIETTRRASKTEGTINYSFQLLPNANFFLYSDNKQIIWGLNVKGWKEKHRRQTIKGKLIIFKSPAAHTFNICLHLMCIIQMCIGSVLLSFYHIRTLFMTLMKPWYCYTDKSFIWNSHFNDYVYSCVSHISLGRF